MNRKDFLKKTARGSLAAIAAGSFLNSGLDATEIEAYDDLDELTIHNKTKSVIYLNMAGGMSHIDTFDPKKGSQFRSVNTSIRGVQISDRFKKTAKVLKHLNIIRSMTSKEGDHKTASYMIHTGNKPVAAFTDIPSIGAVTAFARRKKGPYFPGHVTIGSRSSIIGRSGFLGTRYESFHVGNVDRPLSNIDPRGRIDTARLYRRDQLLQTLNAGFNRKVSALATKKWQNVRETALDFMNSDKLQVFDIKQEPASALKAYSDTRMGKSMLLARRLAQAEVPFIEITMGGWDTHENNRARITDLTAELDTAFAALIQDLATSGLLKQTVVALITEFGRTPKMAANGDGRDHYPNAFSALIGGGPMKSGMVIGKTDKDGAKVTDDPVEIPDYIATLYHAAGIDYNFELKNSMGRPFGLTPVTANHVDALF